MKSSSARIDDQPPVAPLREAAAEGMTTEDAVSPFELLPVDGAFGVCNLDGVCD